MTEERLKEIKDSIDYGITGAKLQALKHAENVYNEELELYKEVIRLRKALNCKIELCKYLPEDTEIVVLTKEDYERKKLTHEQLTGVENE